MQAGGTIYGKTGEAEIDGGSHAWFTGYRDDDIAFATLVVLGGGSETSVQVTDNFLQKLDPYLNVDPGTMNPCEHGEVFVTEDGAETDLDLGRGAVCCKQDC